MQQAIDNLVEKAIAGHHHHTILAFVEIQLRTQLFGMALVRRKYLLHTYTRNIEEALHIVPNFKRFAGHATVRVNEGMQQPLRDFTFTKTRTRSFLVS